MTTNSITDSITVLQDRNRSFAEQFDAGDLTIRPRMSTIILTCVDSRVDPAHIFGLALGDAVVMRNDGGRITPEVMRDFAILSVLGANMPGPSAMQVELVVMHHTDCGMSRLANPAIQQQVAERLGLSMDEVAAMAISKFGVVLIKAGSEVGGPAIPHTIGTMAHIVQVNRVDGGRMFISIFGQQRFQIKEITQNRPYMAAQVELMEDAEDVGVPPTEMEAIRKAASEHVTLTLGMRGGWVRESKLPSDPTTLSYFIAGVLQAQLPDKQALLEASTTSKRLESELDLLRRESEVLKRQVSRELRSKFGRQ